MINRWSYYQLPSIRSCAASNTLAPIHSDIQDHWFVPLPFRDTYSVRCFTFDIREDVLLTANPIGLCTPFQHNSFTSFNVSPQGMEGGGNQRVWVSDPIHGFVQGSIIDLNPEGVTVQPLTKDRNAKPLLVSYDRVYPAEEDERKDVDDNCEC